jgi:hypothetical protein
MKSLSISSKKINPNSEKKNTFLTFLSYLIPITIILLILYVNYLPFGYEDEKTIDVGSKDDTSGVFFLEETPSLGSRQTTGGETFRFVDGVIYAIYKPKVILKDANIEVKIKGENVYFPTPPSLDFLWDYDWKGENFTDFEIIAPASTYEQFLEGEESKEMDFEDDTFVILFNWTADQEVILANGDISLIQNATNITLKVENHEIIYNLPDYFLENEHSALLGFANKNLYFFVNEEFVEKKEIVNEKVFEDIEVLNGVFLKNYEKEIKERIELKENCVYFDGYTRLVLPESQDLFEEGPFAIYIEWIPEKVENSQQLMGHYNWEISQGTDNITFQIGRMEQSESFSFTKYTFDEDFFEKQHSLLAIYNPSTEKENEGHIELFIDGFSSGKVFFEDDKIRTDYGEDNLSLGWSRHNNNTNPYFQGKICNARFSYKELKSKEQKSTKFEIENQQEIKIPIFGEGELKKVSIHVKK